MVLRTPVDWFRTLSDTTTAAILIYQGERVVHVNQACALITGYTADELLAMPFWSLIHPEDRELVRERGLARQRGEPTPSRYELRIVCKSGEERWMDFAAGRIEWRGRPAVLGTAFDVTERKRAEKALQESEDRYRDLVENSQDLICTHDLEGNLLSVNEVACRITGHSHEELHGSSLRELLAPEARPLFQAYLAEIRAAGRAQGTMKIRTAHGETRYWEYHNTLRTGGVPAPVVRGAARDVTEEVLAKRSLKRSEKRYRDLFERNLAGVYRSTLDGRLLDCNDAFARIYGYESREAALGIACEAFHESAAARRDFVAALWRDGALANHESHARRKDGESLWLLENASLVAEEGGGPEIVGTLVDITDRKRAEEAVRRSDQEYRNLFESANDALLIFEPENETILQVNEMACRIYGFSREELVGSSLKTLTKDVARGEEQIRQLRRDGRSTNFETTHLDKRGNALAILVSSSVIRYQGAEAILSINRDVTERKRAEEDLRVQGAALDAAANAILITDRNGTIVWVNQAFSALTGYSAEEAVGRNPRELIKSGAHDQQYYERMWSTLLAGRVWSGEIVNRRKNGSRYAERMTITPVTDAQGEITHFIAIKQDLTDEKRLQAQLLQAQKMDAVGRLAGGVAHDFNNLLTVISGYGDILLRGLEPGPLQEAALEVRRAAERATGLTRQLLAFSRKQTLVPEVLDLGSVIRGLSTMVERLIGEDIEVSVVVPPDLGRVKADRGQVEQVVVNLAINARDAMPNGGSLVFELQNVELDAASMATPVEVEPGPYVLLAVSDTGTGMDAETLRRLFEPFFTTKEAGKGTGLGLATVHGIVRQSGGAISVHSEPGRGATFKVYLPRVDRGEDVPRVTSRSLPAPRAVSETVLVVEDEDAIRRLTTLILREAGYNVLVAEGPAAAERLAASHPGPIHVLLTDVVMPGMRGPELAERMVRARPDLRVLYMSGYTDDAIVHHGILNTDTEFIQKPFTPERLTRKIRQVLAAPGSAAPPT